jgi:hypothetical protein
MDMSSHLGYEMKQWINTTQEEEVNMLLCEIIQVDEGAMNQEYVYDYYWETKESINGKMVVLYDDLRICKKISMELPLRIDVLVIADPSFDVKIWPKEVNEKDESLISYKGKIVSHGNLDYYLDECTFCPKKRDEFTMWEVVVVKTDIGNVLLFRSEFPKKLKGDLIGTEVCFKAKTLRVIGIMKYIQ